MADIAELDAQEGSRSSDPALDRTLNEPQNELRAASADPRPLVAPCTSPPFMFVMGSAVLALVFGMIGACLSLNLFENSSQAAVSNRPVAAGTHAEADSGGRAFRTQLTALGRRLEGLKEKIDALPNSEPTPGLTALQSQVTDLNRSHGEMAALPKRMEHVDSRLEQVSRDVELLHREVLLLQSKLGKDDPSTAPTALPIVEAPQSEALR